MQFERFVGCDWSGAKGSALPGLQVAVCSRGRGVPRLVAPASGRFWSRMDVMDWVLDLAKTKGPVLAGFDFGMGFPHVDEGVYFPGGAESPKTVRMLWRAVDRAGDEDTTLYGGGFAAPASSFFPYFNLPWGQGDLFTNRRLRVTEAVCGERWSRPSGMFNGVGPGSVAIGSLAGMRFLHRLVGQRDVRVAVWPFDDPVGADLVVVEIFPRLYALQAGCNPRSWREPGFLSAVARAYPSRAPMVRGGELSEDKVDALMAAMALRCLAEDETTWRPPGMTRLAARYEGWIFGVKQD